MLFRNLEITVMFPYWSDSEQMKYRNRDLIGLNPYIDYCYDSLDGGNVKRTMSMNTKFQLAKRTFLLPKVSVKVGVSYIPKRRVENHLC